MIYFCVKFQKDSLVAILKILKTKSITAAILNFFQPLKGCHTLRWIFLQSLMKFDEKESKKVFYHPFFVSMATAAKFVQLIPIFLAYLVPLDVDVVPIKFHQFLFGK